MKAKNPQQKPYSVLDSWCSLGEKTVFVLDRSQYSTHVSCGELMKTERNEPQSSSMPAFDRSLWTCTVEAVVGYSRLVWDLFSPEQRCISILAVSPSTATSVTDHNSGTILTTTTNVVDTSSPELPNIVVENICTWRDEHQNIEHLRKSLARRSYTHQIGPGQKLISTDDISSHLNSEFGLMLLTKALDQALDDLCQLTPAQAQVLERRSTATKARVSSGCTDSATSQNNGRVVLVTSFKDNQAMLNVVANFERSLAKKNESISGTIIDHQADTPHLSAPLNYCDLVIINTFPMRDSGPCSRILDISAFKPQLHVKSYSVRSSRMIAGLLDNLCLQHHNLKSTTITGIPMKEEQNANSSSQYDVEIIHCSSIHEEILSLGEAQLAGNVAEIDRNGFPCRTFKLNWCTVRLGAEHLNQCVATSRITSVDLNSRPSMCLINFLLNGKQVLLDLHKSKSNRTITHVLESHNGELYIHSLATSRHKLFMGDPPPISDGLGGKVGDYRMNDFINLMKQHTLVKCPLIDQPLSRSQHLIKRQTLYWPLTIGHTILWNVNNLLGGLLAKIPKESLSQADVNECKLAIDNLKKFEMDGQGLPSITIADMIKTSANTGGSSKSSGGATKLDQLYKLLWNELDYFLRVNSTSAEHEAVLDHLLERHHGGKHQDRGTKRSASKIVASAGGSAATSSPTKKQKLANKLLPEITDEAALEQAQQTAIFYKSGVSVFRTWSHIYHLYHKSRSKLEFVGRLNNK